jgi:hypothetical protein
MITTNVMGKNKKTVLEPNLTYTEPIYLKTKNWQYLSIAVKNTRLSFMFMVDQHTQRSNRNGNSVGKISLFQTTTLSMLQSMDGVTLDRLVFDQDVRLGLQKK